MFEPATFSLNKSQIREHLYPLGQFKKEDVEEAHKIVRRKAGSWLRDPAVRAVDFGYRIDDGEVLGTTTWFWSAKDFKGVTKRLTGGDLAPAGATVKNYEEEARKASAKKARKASAKKARKASAKKARKALAEAKGKIEKDINSAYEKPAPWSGLEYVKYERPWIRVHVDRKLEEDLLDRRMNYAAEIVDGKWCVNVVEGLYSPTANGGGMTLTEISTEIENLKSALKRLQDKVEPTCDEAEGSRRVEPLVGGVGVGNARGSGGTLGAIVWDKPTGSPAVLSNCHVLAGGGARRGEPCVQPAMSDGGDPQLDTVANLTRWTLSEKVDAAIAILNGRRGYDAGAILGIGSISGVLRGERDSTLESEALGLLVEKRGRSTVKTKGFVDGAGMAVKLDYPDGVRTFLDQIHIVPKRMLSKQASSSAAVESSGEKVIEEVTKAGDSGSVWIDVWGRAVGLHFAGDVNLAQLGDYAVANRMADVEDELEISLTPVYRRAKDVEEAEKTALVTSASTNGHRPQARREVTDRLVQMVESFLDEVLDQEEAAHVLSRIQAHRAGPHPRPAVSPSGGGEAP